MKGEKKTSLLTFLKKGLEKLELYLTAGDGFRWKAKKKLPRITVRQKQGGASEDAAAELLRRKGFTILEQNWRHQRYEIDLIAREGGQLVFVEVRFRKAGASVDGLASIGTSKRKALRRAFRAYLRGRPLAWRFDVVSATTGADGQLELTHYPCCKL